MILALAASAALVMAAGEGEPPPFLQEMLEEKGEDGQPILGPAERAKLDALPPHTRQLISDRMEAVTVSAAAHLKILLSLDLSPQTAELVFSDNCVVCHTDPEAQKKANLLSPDPKAAGSPAHLDLKELLSDVHFRRGLSCSGCHGGSPDDTKMTAPIAARWPKKEARGQDRAWIVDFCGRCHADPAFMRGFNPALPTDQVAKYRESQHGQLLLQRHDSKAAQCVSCHLGHGIRAATSRQSTVHPQRVPETCGACHADPQHMAGYTTEDGKPLPTHQLAEFRASAHGRALLERGDTGAPACNDCHGNHAAMPPQVASVSQVCRTCHSRNGTLFDGSKHKKAFEQHGWPECGQCHGEHDIQEPSDALISDAPGTLCGDCHQKHAAKSPQCNEGARHFRTTLDALVLRHRDFPPQVERLAERGLDVEPLEAAVGELEEAVVQSRSSIHAFDPAVFDGAAEAGHAAVRRADLLVAAAMEEHRFRRNGLLASIGVMAFLAVTLALKIRQLDRRRGSGGTPHE